MTVSSQSPLLEPTQSVGNEESEAHSPASPLGARGPLLNQAWASERACPEWVAQHLSPALAHIAHQPATKSRDRAVAALLVLTHGPAPFAGAHNIKYVAKHFGMTGRNLHPRIDTPRGRLDATLHIEGLHE